MPRIKHATGGGAIHPKISFVLHDDKTNKYYCTVRKMDKFCKGEEDLSGYRCVLHQDELMQNWELSKDGKPLNRINPLV